jgi:stage IV sporulation protein FB
LEELFSYRSSSSSSGLNQSINPSADPSSDQTGDIYPPKPKIDEVSNASNWWKTILSILLFAAAFKLVLGADLMLIFIAIIVLIIHEGGHLLAMKYYGFTQLRMVFVPLLGALAMGKKDRISQSERAIILLAGPVPGILIGLSLLLFLPDDVEGADYWIKQGRILGFLFIIINSFNLLPVAPLDGGRLIEALFFSTHRWASHLFILLSALGMVGLIALQQEWYLIIIPIFLLIQLPSQIRTSKLRAALEKDGNWPDKRYEELKDEEYWFLRQHFLLKFPKAYSDAKAEEFEYAKSESQIANSLKNLLYLHLVQDMSPMAKAFTLMVWVLFLTIPILIAIVVAMGKML